MSDNLMAAYESRLWDLIEAAWERLGAVPNAIRSDLADRDSDDDAYALDEYLDPFLFNLRVLCEGLSGEELTALDQAIERKLYDIDRADIHEVTGGSDDGFLYCRGFVVAMGHDFYGAVVADPEVAVLDGECEGICYFFARLHNDRFGVYPPTVSAVCRESTSNRAGWT